MLSAIEVWKWVEGFEGRYKISSLGNLHSYCRGYHKRPIKWCRHTGGYSKVSLTKSDGKMVNKFAHRVVAEVFLENPDNLPQVGHKNDKDKTDNRASQLYWCSAKTNIQDAHKNGVMRKGGGTNVKVSDEIVKEMYLKVKSGAEVTCTAKLYGVPRTTLSSIMNKRSRTNVTDQL